MALYNLIDSILSVVGIVALIGGPWGIALGIVAAIFAFGMALYAYSQGWIDGSTVLIYAWVFVGTILTPVLLVSGALSWLGIIVGALTFIAALYLLYQSYKYWESFQPRKEN